MLRNWALYILSLAFRTQEVRSYHSQFLNDGDGIRSPGWESLKRREYPRCDTQNGVYDGNNDWGQKTDSLNGWRADVKNASHWLIFEVLLPIADSEDDTKAHCDNNNRQDIGSDSFAIDFAFRHSQVFPVHIRWFWCSGNLDSTSSEWVLRGGSAAASTDEGHDVLDECQSPVFNSVIGIYKVTTKRDSGRDIRYLERDCK